jgi:2-polyprenyl-3-methyl-5-hydroxy-6-metoxy-1,4-benzoquinol methylase
MFSKTFDKKMKQSKSKLLSFYTQVGEKYPEQEIVYQTLRGKLRKKFILQQLEQFNGSLLDVGCNRGMYLLHYHKGPRYGIDISYPALSKIPGDPGLYLVVADAEDLECFQPACFKNVLCSEVLEHCLNPQRVFKGIYHVLEDKGVALITTPNYRNTRPEWIKLGSLEFYGIKTEDQNYYHTAFKPEELCRLAQQQGFTVLKHGTLEKEIKYAAKIPVIVLLTGRAINRLFKCPAFERFNENLFQKLSIWIYDFCHKTRLEKLFLPFIRTGVRSYIVIRKDGGH